MTGVTRISESDVRFKS